MPSEPFPRPAWLLHGAIVPLGGTYYHVREDGIRGVVLHNQGRAVNVPCEALFDAPWELRGTALDYFPQPLDLPEGVVVNPVALMGGSLPPQLQFPYATVVPRGLHLLVRFDAHSIGWYVVDSQLEGVVTLTHSQENPLPSWFFVGARISMQFDDRECYVVESISDDTFRAFKPQSPTVGLRYQTATLLRDWTPTTDPNFFSANMARANLPVAHRGAVMQRHDLPEAELRVGDLVQPKGATFYFKVVSINFETASYTIQRVRSYTDRTPVNNRVEDLPFVVARKSWMGAGGAPEVVERSCPLCGKAGFRDFTGEEAFTYPVRAYKCESAHAWTVYHGGIFDGQPTPTSRFDRDPV